MPKTKSPTVNLNICGVSVDVYEALCKRARDNNRSVSGEVRSIIQAEISALHHALGARPATNAEQ